MSVGETGRTAQQRIREHQADRRLGRTDRLAIAEHVHNKGHEIFWKPAVAAQERNAKQRKIKEALYIHRMEKQNGSMNKDNELQLSRFWLDTMF